MRPALRMAMGLPNPIRPQRAAVLAETVSSPRVSVSSAVRFSITRPARWSATARRRSHHLRWLAMAHALLDIPEDVEEVVARTTLQVWELA